MDALEETHSSGTLVVLLTAITVDKGRDPANQFPKIIIEQPPACLTVLEIDVLFRIEDGINLLIKRTNPGIIFPVDDAGNI